MAGAILKSNCNEGAAPFGTDVTDEALVLVIGVAIGVLGAYVTPFAVAATWKTEPPPNS